jgi:[ribosomal protein S18]-alanine N-acetyltransferase
VLRLRAGSARDLPFLQELAAEAFAEYGAYQRLLPEWAATPGIELTVAEDEGARLGLTLVGVFEDRPRPLAVVDLLAIAVVPAHRRTGVGRVLLQAVVARASHLARTGVAGCLRLTVAEGNAPGRALFGSAGFRYSEGHEGHYPRGQRALRMELALPAG